MPGKKRPDIAVQLKRTLESSFQNRCAICRDESVKLDIHHIDEDPENNDPMNLVPLCPTCHRNQHHGGRAVGKSKMQEYRRLREPVILAPQFHPLFVRLEFLRRVTPTTPVKEIDRDLAELVQFVRTLNMGQFYGDKMEALLKRAQCIYIPKSWRATDSECEAALAAEERKYRDKVAACHAEVWELIMELCSFQGWRQDKHSSV